jgi:hypothetical protein
MRFTRNILPALLAAFLLSGCGSGTSVNPATSSPTYPSVTGNWAITANSQLTATTFQIGGYIVSANPGTVTGVIHALNSACYSLTQDVPITGTISTAGAISITSSVVSSQVITLSGTISNGSLSGGAYTITGGCAAGDHGTVTGYIAQSYGNAYAGSFFSIPSHLTIGTSITTAQTGPDVDGLFHVTGTATFTGSPCFTSGSITSSTIAGAYMSVTIATSNGTVTFYGYATDSTGKTVVGDYTVAGGTCNGDYGTGSVSHS